MDWTTRTIEALLAPRTNYERKRPDRPRFSLEPTRALLRDLGCEHPAPLVVQIGGSKGKGTTASYLSALLQQIGLRVGVYASPHAVTIRERIRIDGELGPSDLLVRSVREALRWAGESPSFFEVMTAAACLAFQEARVDVALFEVGLGGRLDSTTAVEADASILTRIELEHTNVLGPTRYRIAQEKAPVLRPGKIAWTAVRPPALAAVRSWSRSVDCQLLVAGRDFDARGEIGSSLVLRVGDVRHPVRVDGAPSHESEALGLAFAVCEHFFPGRFRQRSLRRPPSPGRCEVLQDPEGPGTGEWIVDGAHTAESAQALASFWRRRHGDRKGALLFGSARDKDWRAVLSPLVAIADEIQVTGLPDTVSEDPATIRDWLRSRGVGAGAVHDLASGMDWLRARSVPRVVAGSFVLVGEVHRALGRSD